MKQYNNSNSIETTKSYIIFTILAGILTLIPISSLILGLIDSNIYISDNIYVISFYIVKIIGFLIYFCKLKEITKPKKIIAIIATIFLFMSIVMYNQLNSVDDGIDSIAAALLAGMAFNLCTHIYYIFTFILFITYAKKFIFKKKAIITIIIAIILIILLAFIIHCTSIQKVNDDIPSVSDFKNQLVERNLYTNQYLLYGVDNIENNIHKIDFNSDSNKKYPSYVYYGYKTKNLSNKYDDNAQNWVIYYTNGKLYAALGFDNDDGQSIHLSYHDYNILSEDDKIYTYNWRKNYYEKINIKKDGVVNDESLRYHYANNGYNIAVLEKSQYYNDRNYKITTKIDSNTLDTYANDLDKSFLTFK